ncbi:MAG: glycosyltransferase, partial [Planctomycetota bacterium]
MNILLVSNAYPSNSHQGGIFVKNQVKCLRALKLNIITLVRKGVTFWTYLPFWMRNFLFLLSKKYDLVHAHYGFHSALIAAVMKREPLVTTFHGSDALTEPSRNRIYSYLQKLVVSRSDHLIAVSNEVKNVLVSDLNAEPSRVSVISCGVDTEFFAPAPRTDARKKLGMDESEKVVLFVGHVTYGKGIDILCECARRISDTTFVVLGKGTFKAGADNCKLVGNHPN